MKRVFHGISASPGIGIGHVLLYREAELGGWSKVVEDAGEELERFHGAVRQFCIRTEQKADCIALAAGPKQAEILRSQAEMARDPYLNGQIEGCIASAQCAEAALTAVCGQFIDSFSAAEDELLRQRAADVRDLRNGMLRILLGLPDVDFSDLEPGTVLVADELSPSAVSGLDATRVAGILLRTGGRTSHCAILARAMEIPMVMGLPNIIDLVEDGETVVVDGSEGNAHLDLSPEELAEWEERQGEFMRLRESLRRYIGRDTVDAGGERVRLDANVGNENDVLRAEELGCDGVGLFRSEFLYQERDSLPDEEEQFRVYRRMALAMKGRPLVVRSLDAGGDKELPYLRQEREENPQLGCRALRLCLRDEKMFLTQLRAVLRAGAFGDVRLMLPMVTGVEEVRRVKALLERAKEELRQTELPFREDLPLGVTMETAASALVADLLAREADFFSIGTNDLTQYTLAVDRENSAVAYLYSYYHPAVLRAVRRIVECAKAEGIPVGLCGEAAADPLYLPVLLSLGLDELSVQPSSILSTRKALAQWTREEARRITAQVFDLETEPEVRALLERNLRL